VVVNCCILHGDEGDWEQGLTIHQVTSIMSRRVCEHVHSMPT